MKFRGLLSAAVLSAFLVPAQAAEPAAVEIASEPHHHLLLENPSVRVFLVSIAPHESTLLHRHDYVSITLGDSEVSNEVEGKAPVHLNLRDGETYFLPGNYAHLARNLAATPFRNLIVELQQDEKPRKTPPPKWDRGTRSPSFQRRHTGDSFRERWGARIGDRTGAGRS
jgi:quercetin dioxygenase-like cupin family protein